MFKLLVILTIFVFCNESRHLYNKHLVGRTFRSRNFKYYYLLRKPPPDFNVFFDMLTDPPSGVTKRNCALPKNTCDYDYECPSYQKCCEDTFCDFKVCKSISDKAKAITKRPEVGNEVLKEQECSFPCVECVLFDIKCSFDYNCPPCYSCCEKQCKYVNETTTETVFTTSSTTNSEDILPSSTDASPSLEIVESDLSSDVSVSESAYTTQATTTTAAPSTATKIPQSSIGHTTDFFSSLETEESDMSSDLSTSDQESVNESTYSTQTTITATPTREISTLPPSVATKIPQSSITYITDFVSSLETIESNMSSDLSTSDQESVNESTYSTQTTAAPTTTRKISTVPPSVGTKISQSSIKYTTNFFSSLETDESNLSSEHSTSYGESVNESTHTTALSTTTRKISTLPSLVTKTKPTTTLKPSTISVSEDSTTGFTISSTNGRTVDTEFSTAFESSGSGSGDADDDEDLEVHRTIKITRPTTILKPLTTNVSVELTTGSIISSTNRGTVDADFSTAIESSGSGDGDDDEDFNVHKTTKTTKKQDDDAFFFSKDNSPISTDQPNDKKGKRDDDFDFSITSATDKNKLATSVSATPTVLTTTAKDVTYTSTSTITTYETSTAPRSVTEKTQKPANITSSATVNSNNDPSTAKPTSHQKSTFINSQPPSNSTTTTIKSNITSELSTKTTKEVSSAATATASAKSVSDSATSTITFTETTTRLGTLSNTPTSMIAEEEATLSVNASNLITTTSNVLSTEYISATKTLKGEEGSGDLIDQEGSGVTFNTLIDQENGSGSGSGDDNDDEDLQKKHTKEWRSENKSTVKPELEARKEQESDYESIDQIIEPKIQSGNLANSDYYVIIDDLDVPKFNIKRSEKVKAKEKSKRKQKIS